jgi:SAM-dependent methyltransferase
VEADFDRLPAEVGHLDLAVAAFCLYHSPHPERAVAEIARCLLPAGCLIVTTKSAGSYHDIDVTIAASGLDPGATERPSLYQSFHTDNAEAVLAAAGLALHTRLDERHQFRFANADHLAEYVVTCPKYQLPAELTTEPAALAAALRARLPNPAVTTASTVTYLVAVRP